MRQEIPIWVAVLVIALVVVVAAVVLWRGTEVRKVKEEPMEPLKKLQQYGVPFPGAAPTPSR
jgi:hypothetical protein